MDPRDVVIITTPRGFIDASVVHSKQIVCTHVFAHAKGHWHNKHQTVYTILYEVSCSARSYS